jgi:phage terminase large subunit-like protein
MSRINPVGGSMVLLVGTPWSVIDPIAMVQQSMKTEKAFPQFELHSWPARNADGTYLEEQHFGREWYDLAYAVQGRMATALLDLKPTPDSGERFDISKIRYVDSLPEGLRLVRAWDLASSSKERSGSDYTASCLMAVKTEATPQGKIHHVYVKDVTAFKAEAPERNERIKAIARAEPGVIQIVESFGSYKDAYTTLAYELKGISVVKPSHLSGDKSAKLSVLEAPWDAGHVHILKSAVVKSKSIMEEQFSGFPNAKHDDVPDSFAVAFAACTASTSGFML